MNWSIIERLAKCYEPKIPTPPPRLPTSSNIGNLSQRLQKYIAKIEPGIMGQHGSNPTYKAACCLIHGFNLTPDEAYSYMVEYSNTCSPPWTEKEIRHKLKQANERQDYKGRMRGWLLLDRPLVLSETNGHLEHHYEKPHDPDEFPYDAFPLPIQQYYKAIMAAKKPPSGYVGMSIIGAAAAALGGSRCFRPKNDWPIYPNLWIALVGLSGDSKSPVLEEVMEPIMEIDNMLEAENARAAIETATEILRWEADRKQNKTREPKPKAAPPQAMRVENVTIESLIELLSFNPRGIVLYRDELTGWFESLAQYKPGGKGDDRAIYLSLYSNQGIKVNRKNMGTVSLQCRKPIFGAIGGMQPSVLRIMKDQQSTGHGKEVSPERDDGLKERLAFVYPPLQPLGKVSRQGVDGRMKDFWRNCIEYICKIPMIHDQYDNRLCAVNITANLSTTDLFFQWVDRTRKEADDAMKEGDLSFRGSWIKLSAMGGKLALVIHYLRESCGAAPAGSLIDEIDVESGSKIADFLKTHAKKAIFALGVPPDEEKCQGLFQWLMSNGGQMSMRELERRRPCGLRKKSKLLETLKNMQDLGMGGMIEEQKSGGKSLFFRCNGVSPLSPGVTNDEI